jgi:hypothetical protein
MQLVGVACSVCAEVIRFGPDAGGCPTCKLAFHKACCPTVGRCPKCGCDFASETNTLAHAAQAEVARQVVRGRLIVVWCGIAILVLQLLTVVGTLVTKSDAIATESLRFLVMLAVVMAVYLKFAAARVYLMIALVLNVLVSAFMLLRGAQDNDALLLGSGILVLVVYGTSLVLLSSKPAVLYFARDREVT